MTVDSRLHPDDIVPERPVSRALVWGLIGAPVVWAVHFIVIYTVVALSCWSGFAMTNLLGLGTSALAALAVSLVALALIGWAGRTAYGLWHAAQHEADAPGWQRYAGLTGSLLSGLFALSVVLETVPVFVLVPCV